VLTDAAAADLVDTLELERIPYCPMCFFDLAWAMHTGGSLRGLVRSTTLWVWPDISDAVQAVVVRARMRDVPHAEEALRDLTERKAGGVLARRVFTALARRLADEIERNSQRDKSAFDGPSC
jgi:hypothetical protein